MLVSIGPVGEKNSFHAPGFVAHTLVGPRSHRRLEPALIQAIVRAAYGEFRACYEQGLARDPTLQGRVVTKPVRW